MKFLQEYIRNELGASAVEFALLSPILIVLLIGTVDFGFYIMQSMRLQNVAHASAEYVSQAQDDANVQIIAEEAYAGDFADITLTSEFECECSDGVVDVCPVSCGSNDYQRRYVSVTASGTFQALMPYPGLADDLELESTARMRVD